MKKCITALCIGFFCTLMLHSNFKTTETALANSVLRLHVIANSDSDADQNLKLKVRDRIISETKDMFEAENDIAKVKTITTENLDYIKKIAEDEIKRNGFEYDVSVNFGKSDFPTKEYGNLVLPAGSYEALKVEIGEADGKNWWCVIFPPLCFVDETCVKTDSEAFKMIEKSSNKDISEFVNKEKSSEVELKFKSYEIWQSGRKKLASLLKR